jgi:hypothetical protein
MPKSLYVNKKGYGKKKKKKPAKKRVFKQKVGKRKTSKQDNLRTGSKPYYSGMGKKHTNRKVGRMWMDDPAAFE